MWIKNGYRYISPNVYTHSLFKLSREIKDKGHREKRKELYYPKLPYL